jgi:hypothetical protein
MNDRTTKACTKCGSTTNGYHRDDRAKDGLQSQCKRCHSEATARCNNSERGRALRAAYEKSEAGLAARSRYEKSAKGQAMIAAYAINGKPVRERYEKSVAGKTARALTVKNGRARHPMRHRARDALNSAIRYGKLTKPSSCSSCGRSELSGRQLHGHHHRGYDEAHWLDVVWLCRSCHDELHKQE